jgi:dolichol kinase
MKRLSVVRTLFHLSGAFIPLLYLLCGEPLVLALTLSALALVALAEVLRIKGRLNLAFVQRRLKTEEMKRPTGSFFYLISCLATILLFPRPIAVASILVLAIADPLSSLIGSRWGRTPFFGKSAEGTGVFFFSSLLILACFRFPWSHFAPAAGAAAAAELFSSRFVDDNLTIPLVCALALTVAGR